MDDVILQVDFAGDEVDDLILQKELGGGFVPIDRHVQQDSHVEHQQLDLEGLWWIRGGVPDLVPELFIEVVDLLDVAEAVDLDEVDEAEPDVVVQDLGVVVNLGLPDKEFLIEPQHGL